MLLDLGFSYFELKLKKFLAFLGGVVYLSLDIVNLGFGKFNCFFFRGISFRICQVTRVCFSCCLVLSSGSDLDCYEKIDFGIKS